MNDQMGEKISGIIFFLSAGAMGTDWTMPSAEKASLSRGRRRLSYSRIQEETGYSTTAVAASNEACGLKTQKLKAAAVDNVKLSC